MSHSDAEADRVEALLKAATDAPDLGARSQLISEATAARMAVLGATATESSVPPLEEVMEDPMDAAGQPAEISPES